MSDNVFDRAIKSLNFGLVSEKTDTKLKTFSAVWDVKKLLTYVTLAPQIINIDISQLGAGRLIYQYNFTWGKNTRILNFARIQARLAPDFTQGFIYRDLVYCVKFVKAGIVYRYKISGRHQDLWNVSQGFPKLYTFDYLKTSNIPDAFEPGIAVVAPWYNGEHIESNFVIELWSSAENRTQYNIDGNIVLELSNLANPTTLTDRSFSTSGTGYTRTQLGFTYPQAIPEIYPAATVGN